MKAVGAVALCTRAVDKGACFENSLRKYMLLDQAVAHALV